MPKRVQKEKATTPQSREDEFGPLPQASERVKDPEKEAELDGLLDEIDGVLEENAAEFVRDYIQKGGQ